MRIVLSPSAYHPSVGGVEVLTHRLAVSLAAAGHAVEVWTGRSPGDDLPGAETIDGVTVRRFLFPVPRASARAVAQWPVLGARTLREMRRAASEFRPDLLHVQCFSVNGVYATALSMLRRIPLVVTLQGETVMDDHDIYDHSAFLRQSLRLGLRRAGQVTGCSQFTLDDAILRFGLHREKAHVIFNGVDVEEAAPVPVDLPFERYVLGLGRVVQKKGFDLLIDAFARVAERHADVGLVLVGRGEALEQLRNQASRLGLGDRVHFTGALDRGQVAAVMHGAEVFVMPSRVEPFGIVALEGWRAETPVVVSSHGGAGEFVDDGHSGLVVDPEDRAALGDALDRLLGDPRLRAELSAAGLASLPSFSWARLREQYERCYALVLGGSTR